MCDFIGTCLDVDKLTPKEVECLEEWLQERHDHLQALLNDTEARIRKVNRAFKKLAPPKRLKGN
jgi:hypothetical protein